MRGKWWVWVLFGLFAAGIAGLVTWGVLTYKEPGLLEGCRAAEGTLQLPADEDAPKPEELCFEVE